MLEHFSTLSKFGSKSGSLKTCKTVKKRKTLQNLKIEPVIIYEQPKKVKTFKNVIVHYLYLLSFVWQFLLPKRRYRCRYSDPNFYLGSGKIILIGRNWIDVEVLTPKFGNMYKFKAIFTEYQQNILFVYYYRWSMQMWLVKSGSLQKWNTYYAKLEPEEAKNIKPTHTHTSCHEFYTCSIQFTRTHTVNCIIVTNISQGKHDISSLNNEYLMIWDFKENRGPTFLFSL